MRNAPASSPIGYRPAQVAEVTGLGKTRVFELIANGTLESVKVGRSRIVSARSVRALIEGEAA